MNKTAFNSAQFFSIAISFLLTGNISFCKSNPPDFIILSENRCVSIIIDSNDFLTVRKSAFLLASDIEMITGRKPAIYYSLKAAKGNVIVIGSLKKSEILKTLRSKKVVNYEQLSGKWESFNIHFVNRLSSGIDQAMLISGSDRRGAAYGVFTISEKIGVSPWYWWADIHPLKKNKVSIPVSDYFSNGPSVKYRGVFLNDEDWGLQPWAAKTFEPETGDIGPKTYAKIFELLLRLKANTIWPAMHNCTRAFYHYPGNPLTADTFGIIVGTSHAEPMLRNNVDEWDPSVRGDYNYKSNRDGVFKYWEERIKESSGYENIYTLGMRGIHDSGMEGMNSMEERVDFLDRIISDQRKIMTDNINMKIENIPQVFITYKEVLDIYDSGLKIPDDVTIMWSDDNYGYIRRLNSTKELNRRGGSGVYYHISYWGRPHDYLWLSSTHPSLIREEMIKAYQNGADRMWILNVGDLKPLEYNIQLFMDMAWNTNKFLIAGSEQVHLKEWLGNIFNEFQDTLSNLINEFNSLAFQRRPEFMGWSQTEPTRDIQPTQFNHFAYGDEAMQRINHYNKLINLTRDLYKEIPTYLKDTYYQLVYYPVVCAGLFNKKFLCLEKAYLYARQGRTSANDFALMARNAYDSILLETEYYNTQMAQGKWQYMMSMTPRNLPVFSKQLIPSWEISENSVCGISIEGNQVLRPSSNIYGSTSLPVFIRGVQKEYFIDLFLQGSKQVYWEATPSEDWIKLSVFSGSLDSTFMKKQQRLWIGINEQLLPSEKMNKGSIKLKAGEQEFTLNIQVRDADIKNSYFVETNNHVSIYAENYKQALNSGFGDWTLLKGLGYSGNSIQYTINEYNLRNSSRKDILENPCLQYDFFNFKKGEIIVNIYCIPVHPLNSDYKLQLGIAVDNSEPEIIDYQVFGRSEEWKLNVLANQAMVQYKTVLNNEGEHSLKIYGIDPGVIIDRIIISTGELTPFYGNIKETKYIKE